MEAIGPWKHRWALANSNKEAKKPRCKKQTTKKPPWPDNSKDGDLKSYFRIFAQPMPHATTQPEAYAAGEHDLEQNNSLHRWARSIQWHSEISAGQQVFGMAQKMKGTRT